MKIKGLTGEYTKESFDNSTPEELRLIIEDVIAEKTKNWTVNDTKLINESMKNIASRPIWDAIYQAKKWAFLEARASTVKMNTQKERKEYFDKEINNIDYQTNIENIVKK